MKVSVTIPELNALLRNGSGVTLIDVRSEEEFKEKHIPFAINVPIKKIESGFETIHSQKTIITVCGSGGGRSARAAELLRSKFSANAFFLEEGTFGWLEQESKNAEASDSLFRKFMQSGFLPGDTKEEKIRKSTLLVMAVPFALVGLIWGSIYFANKMFVPGLIPFSYGVLSILSILSFVLLKNFNFFRFSQILLILLLPFFLQLALGGYIPSSAVILWALVSPLSALAFYNVRQSIPWYLGFVALAVIAYLVNDHLPEYFDWQISGSFINTVLLLNIVGASFIIYLLQYYFAAKQSELKKSVEEQRLELQEKNKEITDSINYAKRIQQTMLANEELLKEHLADYFILFKPKDIVSGDFYWAAAKGSKFYLAVCDSTGHGVPGAFMSLLNISFLNEAVNERHIELPGEICGHVRNKLAQSVSLNGNQDGMDGAIICIDRENQKLSYAAAYNAPILVRKGTVMELAADKMPIGKGVTTDDFTNRMVDTEPGDLIYLYTDGYADQFGGPKGKKFKYRQMKALLQSLSSQTLEEQQKITEAAISNWKGNLEQTDDILLVGIRI